MPEDDGLDEVLRFKCSKEMKEHLKLVVKADTRHKINMSDILRECFLDRYPMLPHTIAKAPPANPVVLPRAKGAARS